MSQNDVTAWYVNGVLLENNYDAALILTLWHWSNCMYKCPCPCPGDLTLDLTPPPASCTTVKRVVALFALPGVFLISLFCKSAFSCKSATTKIHSSFLRGVYSADTDTGPSVVVMLLLTWFIFQPAATDTDTGPNPPSVELMLLLTRPSASHRAPLFLQCRI